ncbi:MAG: bifunctional diaminohydroxyphosphoribosylaminopyrimidine deaminase/5-amino-6-(5-phosphoribosylamino)uracil reductase RibD [Bacteroidota bacterium]
MFFTDKSAMKRAIELALRGTGKVSPNPRVGCVIVENGQIIAEGWHEEFGGPHAEVMAIHNADRDLFEGCTLVVNLEPCSHYGKTPPCVDLIIEKRFSKVIVGMIDPNPDVSGSGIQKLQDAGIEVEVGILEEECKWINRFFSKQMNTGLPYVIAKVGQSLDGCIATNRGESKWITSEESRRKVHILRNEVDAVAIGKKTALLDNPLLTVRDIEGINPKRIVFDTDLTLPLNLNIFQEDYREYTYVCCSPNSLQTRKADTLKLAGIKLVPVEVNDTGKLNIPSALYAFTELGISSILVEGGAELLSNFAASQMIDELHLFIAPIIIGNGIHSFDKYKINYLKESFKLKLKALSNCGQDIHALYTVN